ncbi:MAG: DUF2079 domain-containing protein [Thermoplasmatales archaeon]
MMPIRGLSNSKLSRMISDGFIASLIIAALYFSTWSYIDISQYFSFHLHIWDVGINFFLPYQTSLFHFTNSISFAVSPFQPQKLIYFIMVPFVYVFPTPLTVVLIEIFLFSISGFFIFLLARLVLNNSLEALILEFTYLFSYEFYGAAYFPSHYQNLFSVFFVIFFYFYVKGRKTFSSLFLTLSALCSLLGAITVLIFIAYVVGSPLMRKLWEKDFGPLRKLFLTDLYLILPFAIVIIILMTSSIYYGLNSVVSGGHLPTQVNSIAGIFYGITAAFQLKIFYFLLILLPFAFVLLRSKYVILLLPFLILLIFSPFTNYENLGTQYTFDIGTILLIIFIDSESKRGNNHHESKTVRKYFGKSVSRKIVGFLLIVMLINIILLPFGPLNVYAGQNSHDLPFYNNDLRTVLTITENDRNLSKLLALVPLQSSVLGQENMPQITNRALWFEPGMYNGSPLIEYVVADPYSNSFTFIPPSFIGPYPITMVQWFNSLYDSGNYGVYAYLNGLSLLKLNYKDSPIYYSAFNIHFFGNQFRQDPFVSNEKIRNKSISVSNISNGDFAFDTQNNTFILPVGHYKVTFLVSSQNSDAINRATIAIYSQINNTMLGGMQVTGSEVSTSTTSLSFNITVSKYYLSTYFSIYDTHWNGTLSLEGVYLNQISV